MRTLKLCLRDKHANQLDRLSRLVNYLWNDTNDLSLNYLQKMKVNLPYRNNYEQT